MSSPSTMPPEPDEVPRTSHRETTRLSHVVGIGASAGGLEALEKLFASMPLDTGMAFVVVQHLSPDFESHMDQLLARVTKLAVRSVTDGMAVEPNTVYLIPPKMEMVISNGKLLLTERARERTLSHPIDQFLRSLAQDAGGHAIAIILSGTGSDGSRGIADVRENGGLVIAQEASTCRFDAMPVNAKESGNVHLTLRPDAIGQALAQYAQDGDAPSQLRDQGLEAFEGEGVRRLLKLLQDAHGIDFGHYKASTVGRRIQRRIELKNTHGLEEYLDLLSTQPGELNELYKDLLIGVTEFFRDPDAVQLLENRVIPEILAGRASDSIRIWVCGCATGEEAYSLAMLFWEAIQRIRHERGQDVDFNMFATDAHRESLQYAAAGIYPEEKLKNVSAARREQFFEKRGDGYHVKPHLRRTVVFAPHNVINDPPFTQMDLVSCRNLLIYLRPAAQRKTLSLFHFALRPSGTLWLGPSESTGEIGDEFDTVDGHWKVFRKRRNVRLPIDMRLPTPGTQLTHAAPSAAPFTSGGRKGGDLMPAVYDALLSRLMPPSVLVNERFEIVHTFEGMSAYLRFPTGRPTANVLEVVYPEIKTSLAGALQHAVKENKTVRYSGMPTPDGDPEKQLRLVVEPITLPSAKSTVLLVTFDEAVTPPSVRDSDEAFDDVNLGQAAASRIETLEKELDYTRQNLQATIEELETSNEELQATNEEMVASNEELQSTNEELHSVNEELHTVNAEHQRRLAELDEANADMENLLASTRVGVVFLDRELCIRRFTPEIARTLYLEKQDIGRSLRKFVGGLSDDRFIERVREVLESETEREWEVSDERGIAYLIRVLPYRRDAGIQGVVVAFIDVQPLKKAQEELRLLEKSIAAVKNGILITDADRPDHPITFVNQGFLEMTGYGEAEVLGRNCRFLQGENTSREAVSIIRESIAARQPCNVLIENYRKDGSSFWNDLEVTPVTDADGTVTHFVGIQNDVTERVRVGEAARASADTVRLLLDSTAEGIFGVNARGLCTFCNQSAAEMFGYPGPDSLVSKPIRPLLGLGADNDSASQGGSHPILESLETGEKVNRSDQVFFRADGSSFPVEYWSYPIIKDDEHVGVVMTFVDSTERLRKERELREARRQADSANEAKSRFLASMSHELRSPLSAMLGYADILQEQLDEESVLEKVSLIRRNGGYLLRLLNDLLDLSAIEAGKFHLNRDTQPLQQWLDDIHDVMQMRATARGCRLRFEYPGPLPETITTDAARLRQVMVNLISNAIKFAPQGEIVVTAEMVCDSPDAPLVLSVRDNGIGIASDKLDQLFEPFRQADESIGRKYGGTGLGLSISRRLVESLGGEISVQSEEGEGTQFHVSVPVAPAGKRGELEAADRPGRSAADPGVEPMHSGELGASVLIVDDMQDIRFIAQHFLKKAGCDVQLARDGREALEMILDAHSESDPFDVVLMDMHMPEFDGADVVKKVRDRGVTTPIVALTADAMKGMRRRALEIGFDEFVEKPLDSKRLVAVVGRLAHAQREQS